MWRSRKPVALTVSDSSVLVVPARSPATILDWEETTAYTYGQVVRTSGGLLYWCVVAGTSSETEPTHTDGDAADDSVTWRKLHSQADNLVLVNDSSVVMYLGIGQAAEANKGIRLNAAGGSMNFLDFGKVPECAIYAIAASAGSNNLGIQEG